MDKQCENEDCGQMVTMDEDINTWFSGNYLVVEYWLSCPECNYTFAHGYKEITIEWE